MEIKNNRLFLIQLRGSKRSFIFSSDKELLKILKLAKAGHGIALLKEYQSKSQSFGRISGQKKSFMTNFSYNTEIVEDYFKQMSYFDV